MVMSEYTVTVQKRLDSFAVNMKDQHKDDSPYVMFVPGKDGDFVALTIGPISFYLDETQARRLAEMATKAVASFQPEQEHSEIGGPKHDCSSVGGYHTADCQLALARGSAAPQPGDYGKSAS